MSAPGGRCQNPSMPPEPRPGPTAFVLAGGGTKGSFEVGVLQYLVGVEGIAPDIITATSAGAIAATVLAQARTLPEFLDRVNEIEGDVLAWTQTEHVFGKQAWLGALGRHRPGPRDPPGDHRGHPAALPADPIDRAGGQRGGARVRCRPQGAAPGPQGPAQAPAPPGAPRRRGWAPATACPAPTAQQRELGAQPGPAGGCAPPRQRGRGPGRRSGPDRPPRLATPAGRHRVACRRPALRHRGRHPGGVRRPDPRAGRVRRTGRPGRRRHRVGQRAHGLPAPPHGRRRLRRRRGHRDRPGVRRRRPRRDPDHRRGGGAAAAAARRAGLCGGPGRVHRAPLHGDDRGGGAADLEPEHPPSRRDHVDDGRSCGRRGRPVRNRAGAPAHQQGLRLAARRRPPGRR